MTQRRQTGAGERGRAGGGDRGSSGSGKGSGLRFTKRRGKGRRG